MHSTPTTSKLFSANMSIEGSITNGPLRSANLPTSGNLIAAGSIREITIIFKAEFTICQGLFKIRNLKIVYSVVLDCFPLKRFFPCSPN